MGDPISKTLLNNCKILDVVGSRVLENQSILIDGNHIERIFAMEKQPPFKEKLAKDSIFDVNGCLAIQKRMLHSTEVPLANARKCREVSNLADQSADKFNIKAASDLQCAQYLSTAGLNGCAANVRINLPAIKDQTMVQKIEAELMELLSGKQSV